MRLVLDTDVVLSALISPRGASRLWLLSALQQRVVPVVTVSLVVEYEAVLKRPDNLARAWLSADDVDAVLDRLLTAADFTRVAYLWRPTLRDPGDEMVLEAAVNGRADWLMTFNERDYAGARRFGVQVGRPGELWKRFGRSL